MEFPEPLPPVRVPRDVEPGPFVWGFFFALGVMAAGTIVGLAAAVGTLATFLIIGG